MVIKVKEGPFDKRLKALMNITKTNKKKFADAEARIRIYPKSGTAVPASKARDANSISSPLVEKANSREYYDEVVNWDSTGFFSITWSPLKSTIFVDQNGQDVVFEFNDPAG